MSSALDVAVPWSLSTRILISSYANPSSGVVTAVLQHALSLAPPHPVEMFSAAMRCFTTLGMLIPV